MVKFIIWGVLFFLCCCCKEGTVELRGEELCQLIRECKRNVIPGARNQSVDSLVQLSAELSDAERYAVLWHGAQEVSDDVLINRYLKQMQALGRPKAKDKVTALMLLRCYQSTTIVCDEQYRNLCDWVPWAYEPEWVASLLFDLKNRWRLSLKEEHRFLVRKAEVYRNVFQEYNSAQLIAKEGLRLVREHGGDSAVFANYIRMWLWGTDFQSKQEKVAAGEEFVRLLDTLGCDLLQKRGIYAAIGFWCVDMGDYPKAYEYMSRIGLHSLSYAKVIPMYLGLDSIPEALAFLEEQYKTVSHPAQQAYLAWNEALIRERMGDDVEYERCLRRSLEVLAIYFPEGVEYESCGVSEAYSRLLWQRGQRVEAIRRMESATERLLKLRRPRLEDDRLAIDRQEEARWLSRFRLLRDYYNLTGRNEDAFRQSLLCDSLEGAVREKLLRQERRQRETTVYSAELARILELQEAAYQRKQLLLRFSYLLLGLALLGIGLLWIFYRRRQQQLNILYARQKEIEQLEAEKRGMASVYVKKLSPEEELFRELEKQFYDEELFRNPGFSRDDLCRLGGSNRMYVSTCINKYAGSNINQWINKARIDYAIRLIGEGEDDLMKLSELSGFSSLKSFFRSFKQFTELTPRQYIIRERQAKEA